MFYIKRGSDRMCIEHCAGHWQIKLLVWKGNPINIKAHCAGKCALETCGAWVVNDGQRWTEQLDVRMAVGADAAVMLSSPAPKAVFSVGLKVTIADLKSRPELNGCGGKIIGSFDAEKQRWPVKVIPKVGTHEELMLREANIAPRTHTPFATDDSVSVHSGSGAHSRNLDPQQLNGASHALPSDGILQFCDNPGCGKKLRESKRLNGLCRACQTVRYCGSACQRLHWPQHQEACKLVAKVSQMVANDPVRALQLKKDAEALIPAGRPLPRGSTSVVLTGTALGIQLQFEYDAEYVQEGIEIFRRKPQTDAARAIQSCETNLRRWPPGEACLDRSPNGKWCMLREGAARCLSNFRLLRLFAEPFVDLLCWHSMRMVYLSACTCIVCLHSRATSTCLQ